MTTLSPYEIELVNRIQAGLEKCIGKSKAATSRFMVQKMKQEGFKKINDAKLRELIHYLRTERKVFICGDHRGFYVPRNDDEIQHQIKSLNSRIREITEVRDALVRINNNRFKQMEVF